MWLHLFVYQLVKSETEERTSKCTSLRKDKMERVERLAGGLSAQFWFSRGISHATAPRTQEDHSTPWYHTCSRTRGSHASEFSSLATCQKVSQSIMLILTDCKGILLTLLSCSFWSLNFVWNTALLSESYEEENGVGDERKWSPVFFACVCVWVPYMIQIGLCHLVVLTL